MIQTDRLANGFRIVTERMEGLASAALGVWVDAGTRHEAAEQNGIAHFLEHMAFKGTSRRTALQIAEEIEDVGGYLNAYTSRERTAYYARVLSADVPLALDLIADILRDPALAANEIETERGVILQEIGQALDTPDDIIFDWLQEVAFPDQAMGRAILGPPERVRSFTRDDLGAFIRSQYTPERMILSAAGDIDHDRIMRLAESLFADMRPGAGRRSDPALYSGGERREIKALEQAHFALALEAPSYRDPDYHAAQIAASALGGGMSSRLFQEARERRGLCYTIFAQAAGWDETGMLTVYAGTGRDEIAGLARLVAAEIARAVGDLGDQEIARARAQSKAAIVMALESPAARAERMAALMSVWGEVRPIEDTIAKIDAVDVGRARGVLDRIRTSQPTLALYGPVETASTAADLAGLLAA